MAQKPIQIPADLAAKYDQPGQFEKFDSEFRQVAALPPERVAEIIAETNHKPKSDQRGRPAKG
jgi:hypothetical protein